jgi:hypothetical protein
MDGVVARDDLLLKLERREQAKQGRRDASGRTVLMPTQSKHKIINCIIIAKFLPS